MTKRDASEMGVADGTNDGGMLSADDAGDATDILDASLPEDDAKKRRAPRETGLQGDWACKACGNVNYADRFYCNMRKCGAPRPQQDWTCIQCGNMNYADRAFCNMRKCSAPRPGGPPMGMFGGKGFGKFGPMGGAMGAIGAAMGGPIGAFGGMGNGGTPPRFREAMPQNFNSTPPSFGGVAPPQPRPGKGDWMCVSCSNVNFATRAFCNIRTCGLPRALEDWQCECGNMNFADRGTCNMRRCGKVREDIPAHVFEELASKGLAKGKSKGGLGGLGKGMGKGMGGMGFPNGSPS